MSGTDVACRPAGAVQIVSLALADLDSTQKQTWYTKLYAQNPSGSTPLRNALDRMRLRQASRLFAERDRALTRDDLTTLTAGDIRASRVFATSSS